MNRCRQLSAWVLLVFFAALPGAAMAGKAPAVGEQLVPMRLETPASIAAQHYLGLPSGETFDPVDIDGRLLVIEIFSMYCPYCQREAPTVNRLYQAIEASDRLRGRVKMIGIGVGNSTFEIGHFKKHYNIPFPLFPDEDFEIHQAVGEVRTPFFIIVSVGSPDKGKILWTNLGRLPSLKAVTDRLQTLIEQGERK